MTEPTTPPTAADREAEIAELMAAGCSREFAEFTVDMDWDAYEAGELVDP